MLRNGMATISRPTAVRVAIRAGRRMTAFERRYQKPEVSS